MADDRKKSEDALLAELDDEPLPGTPEHMRKLVKMNPRLRPEGLDTNQAADQLRDAMEQAKQFAAAQRAGKATTAAPSALGVTGVAAPPQSGQSLVQVLDAVRAWLKNEQQQVEQHEKQAQAELQAAQKKLSELAARKTQLKGAACDRFIDAMLAIDPNMTSPKTNVVLQSEKAFLDQIGFSPQRLLERERRKK